MHYSARDQAVRQQANDMTAAGDGRQLDLYMGTEMNDS